MKKVVFATVLSMFLFSGSAWADTINGVEIDIPDTMTLATQSKEDGAEMNHYANENEILTVCVQSTDLDDKTLGNLFLFDFADSFSDYDNYVLTNERESDDNGLDTLVQEFVYDNDGWYYCIGGSRNAGDYVISLSYTRLLMDLQHDYDDFLVLFTEHIFP